MLNVFDYNPEQDSYLMEQCDTNLYDYLENEIDLSFDERLKIIMDIVKGMAFAHQRMIIHRDLHLGNILKLGNDYLIADFGLSKDLSIEHSMKSSKTEKNNHLFVDPLAGSDFTKLDQKSDVYSIGKIIDYVFTYNAQDTNHIFKIVVERCISRTKELRYEGATNILNEIENIIRNKDHVQNRKEIVYNICGNHYDSQVHDFIMKLTARERISQFIVEHRLNMFWKIILQFESIYQAEILQTISSTYAASTGYGGWTNYDIFAQISFKLCLEVAEDDEVKNLARGILEECANIRHYADNLLARLPD